MHLTQRQLTTGSFSIARLVYLILLTAVIFAHPLQAAQTPDQAQTNATFQGELHQGQYHGNGELSTPELRLRGEFAYGRPLHGTLSWTDTPIRLEAQRIQALPQQLEISGTLHQGDQSSTSVRTEGRFAVNYTATRTGLVPEGHPRILGQATRWLGDGTQLQATFLKGAPDGAPEGRALRIVSDTEDYWEFWQQGERLSQWPGPRSLAQRQQQQDCTFSAPYNTWVWFGYDCQQGKLNGEGIAYSSDGQQVFIGQVTDNQWQQGSLENAEGILLEGSWQQFALQGSGGHFENGQMLYQGEYQNGQRHGAGLCRDKDTVGECRYFKGKRLRQQHTMLSQTAANNQATLNAMAQRQQQALADFNRERQQRSQHWQQRRSNLRDNEESRQRKVAMNTQLYHYAQNLAEQTVREVQQSAEQTNAIINQAYAEQARQREQAIAEAKQKARDQEEAQRAAQQAREAQIAAQAAAAAEAKAQQQAATPQPNPEELKAQCEANHNEWMAAEQRCKQIQHIIIGYTCFDEQRRPRGCTIEEVRAKQQAEKERQQPTSRQPGSGSGTTVAVGNGQGVIATSGSNSSPNSSPNAGNDSKTSGSKPRPPKVKEFVIYVEATAYCTVREDEKAWCIGPVQKLFVWDDSLQDALQAVGCQQRNPARSVPWQAPKSEHKGAIHFCEYGIRSYELDITKKYSIPGSILHQRSSYKCPKNQGRQCDTLHKRLDGNRPNETLISETVSN